MPGLFREAIRGVIPLTGNARPGLPTFRRYAVVRQLDGHLHTGNFVGGVYLAEDMLTQRRVVLKVVDFASREAYHQLARKEAAVLLELEHPNLIRALTAFEEPGRRHTLVTEFVEGVDGFVYLLWCGNTMSLAEVCAIMLPTGRLFQHLHESGWVWLSCKPANILLATDGRPVVRDVESLRRFGSGGDVVTRTPGYCPPEFDWSLAHPRLDVFAWGVTAAVFMIGEHRVFVGDSVRIRFDGTHVPQAVQEVVYRCVEPNPMRRYQSMAEAVDALEYAAGFPSLEGPTEYLAAQVRLGLGGAVA